MHKCPLCSLKIKEQAAIVSHIEKEHSESVPKQYTTAQYYYMLRTGKEHGKCVMCKRETGWNESTSKYHRFCKDPKCKEAYKDIFRNRMIGTYGKVSLLDDPEHQKKMLANRSISGKYTWSDGKEFVYTGSYELDFLRFLDLFLNFDSSDIMAPSPHTYYYMYKGEKKFYIPDFFIPSLNLEIEVKDGGNNFNNHAKIQAVDRVKEKLKDEVLMGQKDFSYIKVVNKEYHNFMDFLITMKEHVKKNGEYAQIFDLGNGHEPILIRPVVESLVAEDYDLDEGLIYHIMESTSSLSVLEQLRDEIDDCMMVKDELTRYIDALSVDSDLLLQEIDYLTNDNNLDIHSHLIDDYLKQYGYLDIVDRTPGFVSANIGRMFVDIVDRTINDNDLTYVKESLCEQFKAALKDNGTAEMNVVYQRDVKAMEYYFNLLASKLEVKKKDLYSVKEYIKDIVTESIQFNTFKLNGDEGVAVYVLLTHSGTVLSNAIKFITKQPYSHASIAFDPTLNNMYSFGRKYKDNPFIGTFVKESIEEGLYEDVADTATYSLYVTFVSKDELAEMVNRLEQFGADGESLKYSFKGLINYKMGVESDSVNAFFCSQFVDHILSSGKPYFDRHSSLIHPMDFAKHKDFYFVSKGLLSTYDPDKVKAKVVDISKKAKLNKVRKPKLVYLGLTSEIVKSGKITIIPDDNSDHIELPTSLPALRRLVGSDSSITHYTVVPVKALGTHKIVHQTSDSIVLQAPYSIKVTNVNKL